MMEAAGGRTAEPDAAVLRVLAYPPGSGRAVEPLGVGFLVDDRHILTCAHVVADALGLASGDEPGADATVFVDLPLPSEPGSPPATATASVVRWGPSHGAPPGSSPAVDGPDVAVLRLDAAVPGAGPAPLADAEPADIRGHAVRTVGFPRHGDEGAWHQGVVRGRVAGGLVQIDRVGTGYAVAPGFSGSPVWDEDAGAVVGMVATAEVGAPAVSFMVPVRQMAAVWPPLEVLARPPSPFRSLEPFEEEHAAAFFGRDADSDRLARAVARQGWTTLVGPSGCGKSSLARAGVAPRRRADGDTVAVLRPAHHATPVRGLAAVLLDLLEPGRPESEKFVRISAVAGELLRHGIGEVAGAVLRVQRSRRLLVVVDQFEELLATGAFTAADIDDFATVLGVPPAQRNVAVLAVLRSDFLDPVLAHPRLGPLVRTRVEALEPMRPDQLEDAVTKPVAAVPAMAYAQGLVPRILADAGDAPGILPLLSFALAQLWDHRHAGRLTHEAYDALGGVRGALGRHADRAWAECVGEEDREHAARLLTRLVRTPLGAEKPVRRVALRVDMADREWQIAGRLADARILVRGRLRTAGAGEGPAESSHGGTETVELAHDTLIADWPRLRDHATADALFLSWRESLRADVARWRRAGRPRDLLPTATTLAAARDWLPERDPELDAEQHTYLTRGRAHQRRAAALRRTLLALLAVFALVAGVTAGVAVEQRQTVVHQRDRATSAQVAGLAESLGPTDPQLARRLAVAAEALDDTPEAWSALLTTRYQPEKRAARLPAFDVTTSDLDGAGRVLAAAGGRRVGTWDVDTGRQLGSYQTADPVRGVYVSADGTTVAVSTADGTTTVLAARGLHRLGGGTYPTSGARLTLSAKGTYLAATGPGGTDRLAVVWNTRTGREVLRRDTAGLPDVPSLHATFSPDERVLALTGVAGRGLEWIGTAGGKDLPAPAFGLAATDYDAPLSFAPDGGRVAMLGRRGLFTAALEQGRVTFTQVTAPPSYQSRILDSGDVHFSHDGTYVAVGFSVWPAAAATGPPFFTHPTVSGDCAAGTFRFSADGTELRCVAVDGTFHSLDLAPLRPDGPRLPEHPRTAAASQDGSTIAFPDRGTVHVWSTAPLAERAELPIPGGDFVLLSPDGRLVARDEDGSVEIWDAAKGTRLGRLPGSLRGPGRTVAFSPDDSTYATYGPAPGRAAGPGQVTRSLQFYDLRTMRPVLTTTYTLEAALAGYAPTVTFRPDGRAVAVTPDLGLVAFPTGRTLVPGSTQLHVDGFGADGKSAYTDPSSERDDLLLLDPGTLRPQGDPLNVGENAGELSVDEDPVAHSADGRLLAALYTPTPAGRTDTSAPAIGLWDVPSRRRIGPGLPGPVSGLLLTFTADDSTLVSLDDQGTFRTYAVAPARLVHELCGTAGGLTRQEWKAHIPDVPYRRTC
ncbi:hypothetical protein HCN08_11345 [Streptomyces sp. PRB2-1]|uniref:Novel STAND NTPase 1 domain-containing protein n=2 Tax=Actinacidiphila epipremni TaxID=2053013 RepID=A0ABX0ZQV2_9ACTN|nr:hypothetical protein [Actinacidiphila epipremni]